MGRQSEAYSWWTILLFCTISISLVQCLDPAVESNRTVDSVVCTARKFCKEESAVNELMTVNSLSRVEAEEVVDYTHNTSGIVWNSCSCSKTCKLTNNCCPDAEGVLDVSESLKTVELGCASYTWNLVPVIDTCPDNYDDMIPKSVGELCLNGDPNGGKLVKMTSSKTYLTYSNIYCAMCHGETTHNLLPWSLKMLCLPDSIHTVSNNDSIANKSLDDVSSANQCSPDTTAPQTPPKELEADISSAYGAVLSLSGEQETMCDIFTSAVTSCPAGTDQTLSDQCSQGAAQYVTTASDYNTIYRNEHCAICNSIPEDELRCQVCDEDSGSCLDGKSVNQGLLLRFSVLVQPYSTDDSMACQAEEDGSECRGGLAEVPTCNIGEYLDTELLQCVPLCPAGSLLFKGLCVVREEMSTASCDLKVSYDSYLATGKKHGVSTSKFNNNVFYMDLNNGEVICHTCVLTVVTLYEEGLTIFSNGSARMNTSIVDSLFMSHEGNSTYLCLPATEPVDNSERDKERERLIEIQQYQDILTLILCIISICFLVLFFIAFSLVKRMRNIPGSTIAGNMLMFLLAYIVFLARGATDYATNETLCYTISILINYFFIGAFIFMIIYAVLIIRSLEFVDLDSRYTPLTVAKIWIGGILLPFVVIIPALLLDIYVPHSKWSPGYGGSQCFMSHREGNILFFTAPIAVCLFTSMIIYIIVVHRLRQIAAATSRVRASHREKVFLCFKLILVLGFNWISAILVAAVDREKYPVANEILTTIFIVLCCLHGFFGFVVFVASGSNIQLLKAKYSKLSETHSSSGGGKATRTYSGQAQSTTAASELSTMIRKPSPKASPVLEDKFEEGHKANQTDYSSTHETLSPSVDEQHTESPLSTRSSTSRNKCEFF